MATETRAGVSNRPRPWLIVLLGVAIAAYVGMQMFSGRTVAPGVTTTNPRPAQGTSGQPVDPEQLDVRIEALAQAPAGPSDGDRNPFRFQPKPPPPAPPPPKQDLGTPPPPPPPQTPPLTPIGTLIKFIGIVELGTDRVGAFSDCRYTFSGREGQVIEGRFRVVRIGVESAIVEYVDGRGRTTLPLNGQACVSKTS